MTSGYRESEEHASERRQKWLEWLVGGTVALSCFAVTNYFEAVLKAAMGLSNRGYQFFQWAVFFVVIKVVSLFVPRATDRARGD